MGTPRREKVDGGQAVTGAAHGAGGNAGHATRNGAGDAAQADYLAYMADMIHEMRWLAERSGCQTLAGILELAHREAQLEAARR